MNAASAKNGRPLGRPRRAAMRRDVSPFPHRRNLQDSVALVAIIADARQRPPWRPPALIAAEVGPQAKALGSDVIRLSSGRVSWVGVIKSVHLEPPCSRNGDTTDSTPLPAKVKT